MKSYHKQTSTNPQGPDEVTLISVLLGLITVLLTAAFTISYFGGF